MTNRNDITNETAGDARFVAALRADQPRLSAGAMSRVEQAMRKELEAVYPVVKSAGPGVNAPAARPLVLFAFRPFAAMAAMLALVLVLAWHVSSPVSLSPPSDPRLAGSQPGVVEELRIYMESPADEASRPSPLETLFTSVDRHASLVGLDRYARKD